MVRGIVARVWELIDPYLPYAYKSRVMADYRKYLRSRNPMIVYSMPKAGTYTVYRSLRCLELREPVYHSHALTRDDIAELERQAARRDREHIFRRPRKGAKEKLSKLKYVHRLVYANNGKRWKVVTLVREPVAASVSGMFQVLETYRPRRDFQHVTPSM